MFLKKINVLILCFAFFISSLSAHEMWIEPVDYAIKPGEHLFAHEKVGQNFKGNEYSYLPDSYQSFTVTLNEKTYPVTSRIGDIPAVKEQIDEEGLVVLTAATTVSDVTYETWEKFESFIKSKGLDWVLEQHKARQLPDHNFTEAYRRYAKSLIKVGKGEGSDKYMGLPLEWVLDTNPYTHRGSDISAQLLWHGKPLAKVHVGVFNKKGDLLIKTELVTDDAGRVLIPKANSGEFLVNAVKMIEPADDVVKNTGAVWESLWASVTYEIIN